MKEIKIQKIRFPQFKDAWEAKKIGETFNFFATNSLSRKLLNYENGVVKNIHYGDIHTKFKTNFHLKNEIVPYINSNEDLSKISEDSYCIEGDLIIADASEDYKDVGKSIEIIDLNSEKVVAGLHTYIARDLSGQTAKGFKGYMMQADSIRDQIMTMATGSSVLGITKTNVAKIIIRLPSIEEQQKIAGFLTAIDNKIELMEMQLEELKKYKKGLMQGLFADDADDADTPIRRYADTTERRSDG